MMKLDRQLLDEYLDGELAPAAVAAVDQALTADPAARQLLATLRQQRALRAAALKRFNPGMTEATIMTASFLEQVRERQNRPLFSISPWVRRTVGIAAAIALMIGAFSFGRFSNTSQVADNPTPPVKSPAIHLVILDTNGNVTDKLVASNIEVQDVIRQQQQQVAIAETTSSADAPAIPTTGSL